MTPGALAPLSPAVANGASGTDRLPAWARWALPVVLVACVLAAFSPAFGAHFVNFDDEGNLIENQHFRGLSARHLEWMWTVPHGGPYMPLTWLSLAIDHELWGLGDGLEAPEAPLYHATNVLLHALGALAVYLLGRRLLARAAPALSPLARALGAALASLLFAVHPLRVESVAWVTERRDVLSGVLFVLAVAAYVKASPAGVPTLRPGAALAALAASALALATAAASVELGDEVLAWRGPGAVGLALAVLLLALAAVLASRASHHAGARGRATALVVATVWLTLAFLSKALGVMLPLVLLLLDVWPLGRWNRAAGARGAAALALEKAPLFALSIAFGVLAVWGQSRHAEAVVLLEVHSLGERIAQSFYGLWFYVSRTLVPLGLIPLVELPDEISFAQPRFLLPTLVVLAAGAALLALRRRTPALLVAGATFVLLVAPVLGLSQTGSQLVADRYSYLPCLSLALLAGGAWAHWHERAARPATLAVAAAVVLVLGGLTWRQTGFWRSSEALWGHMAQVAPRSGFPHLLLGMLRYREGQEAAESERPALFERAREHFAEGMRLDPSPLPLYVNGYGALLIDSGRFDEALPVLDALLRQRPDDTIALTNIGVTLRSLERPGAAVVPLERAVAVDPENVRGWLQLGITCEALGRKGRAIQAFEQVLERWPRYRPARQRLRELRDDSEP